MDVEIKVCTTHTLMCAVHAWHEPSAWRCTLHRRNRECLYIQCCKCTHYKWEILWHVQLLNVEVQGGQCIQYPMTTCTVRILGLRSTYYTTVTWLSQDCHMTVTWLSWDLIFYSQCSSAGMCKVCITTTFTSLNRNTSPRATQVAASLPCHVPHVLEQHTVPQPPAPLATHWNISYFQNMTQYKKQPVKLPCTKRAWRSQASVRGCGRFSVPICGIGCTLGGISVGVGVEVNVWVKVWVYMNMGGCMRGCGCQYGHV